MKNINLINVKNTKIRIAFALTISLLTVQVAAQQSGGQCVAHSPSVPVPVAGDLPAELSGMQSSLVMEENFDAAADWQNEPNQRCTFVGRADCSNLPDGWDFFYTAEQWHPNDLGDGVHPSATITSERKRGPTGKSYVTWDESWGSPGDWGSEATLAVDLPGSYKDLYTEFWLQFQPGYQAHSTGTFSAKLARVLNYSGTSNETRFGFLHDGPVFPLQIMSSSVWTDGGRDYSFLKSTMVCSLGTGSSCSTDGSDSRSPLAGWPTFYESYGDGGWHKFAFRTKYNSAPGVADGLLQMWVDDELVHTVENITYIATSSPMSDGFNMFMIGGNMNNYPAPSSERLEQWLAYDDIRVMSLSN